MRRDDRYFQRTSYMDTGKIRSYLAGLKAGTLTAAEETWILQFLENASEEELLQIFPEEEWLEQQPVQLSSTELDHAYEHIAPHVSGKIIRWPAAWWKRPAVVSATAAAVLLVGIVVWWTSKPGVRKNREVVMEWKTVATLPGEHIVVYLPDNSRVYVNGASKVMYPEKFSAQLREVKLLEGEIFLDVTKDVHKPFKVITGKVAIDVLGTSFNVRNYTTEGTTAIAVKTGKIAVSSSGNPDSVMLTPGKRIVISEATGNSLLTETDQRIVDGWIKNDLVFTDMKMQDVFRSLEYNYGLTFEIHNSGILDKHIKATFRHKSKWEIVHLLSKMVQFKYEVKDSLIIIK